MAKRVRLKEEKHNLYFTSGKPNLEFVSSGNVTFDCMLGGGYVLGRMANIVGDKSTAKTALAMEALTNFKLQYPDGNAYYREAEAAFDREYQEAMGVPIDEIDFGDEESPIQTVEDFYRDLDEILDHQIKSGDPAIYILDSLDSLSDEAEMERKIDKGSYGMEKSKKLSEMFRKLIRKIERSRTLVIIVSQVRENIGVSFGEKYRRSGGKAMDFYASQIVWLAHTGQLTKTINKVKRAYGVSIKAKCKKNKVGMPFRESEFDFIFGYGIDDVNSSLDWLEAVGRTEEIGVKKSNLKDYRSEIAAMDDDDYREEREKISDAVKKVWNEVEESFIPKRRKY